DNYPDSGVIHGINAVLEIPAADIMSVLALDDDYSDLVALLERVELDLVLSGTTEYTLIAPSNDALTATGVDFAALSDEEVTEILSFHVLVGRFYSVELADGRYETALGDDETDQVPMMIVDELSFEGADVDSVDFNAGNGVVHFVDAAVFPTQTLHQFFLSADGSGSSAELFYDLVEQVGWEDMFMKTDTAFAVYVPVDVADAGDFDNDEDIETYLSQYLFSDQNFESLANGTSVISAGEDKYIVIDIDGDAFLNGTAFVDDSESVYNGTVYFLDEELWSLEPLPTDSITDVMANEGYTLLAKAIEIARPALNNGNVTIFAFDNGDFTALTDYSTTTDLDTLVADGQDADDLAAIAELGEIIDAHTLSSTYVYASIENDLGDYSPIAGDDIFFALVNGDVVVVTDATDPVNNNIVLVDGDILSNSGIIHVLDEPLID
ncbi:fasciclin domain-containing protein, partial [Shewanella sp.]|uniref:fasciclin domain-containing protein n=1 Tax=Shewanella sp. TaxID=50422 RepID=UPI004053EC27